MSKTIIIGAGPAGLAAAYELSKAGQEVLILEKENYIGGISKTINYKNYYFDTGGHRFWTKSREVDDLWHKILGEDFLVRPRLSRIYYKNKFFYYPLKPLNALINLGIWQSISVIWSYGIAQLKQIIKPRQARTFKEWVTDRFGRKLFNIFFDTYTQKVWGIPTEQIGAEWAAQRIKNMSLITAVLDALGLTKKDKIKTLIDKFNYPRFGPGMMYQKMLDKCLVNGAKIEMNSGVKKINHQNNKIRSVTIRDGDQEREIDGDYFLSSMPLSELVNNLNPLPPAEILANNKKLWFRSLITVNFIINKKDFIPDTWIYIHDPNIKAGRLQNFKSWSPYMSADENKINIALEYFSTPGDELDRLTDKEFIELGKKELLAMDFCQAQDIEDIFVLRTHNAYPVYQIGYKTALNNIIEYIKKFNNMQIIGRGGMYRYNNMDHSILTGLYAARNILGEKHNVFAVNADKDYLEYYSDN